MKKILELFEEEEMTSKMLYWVNFFSILLVTIFCISCSSSVDSDLQATVDAQNTRIAELGNGNSIVEETPDSSTKTAISPTVDSGTSDVPTPTNNFEALEVPTLLWSTASRYWSLMEDQVFITDTDNQIKNIRLEDGSSTWISSEKGEVIGSDDLRVYLQPSEQRIDALDQATGESVWISLVNDAITSFTIGEHFIFLRTRTGITIVNKESGTNYVIPQNIYGNFKLAPEDILIVQTGQSHTVGILPENGETIWEVQANIDRARVCGDLFVFFTVGKVEAIYAETGTTAWSVERPSGSQANISCSTSTLYQPFFNLYEALKRQNETIFGPYIDLNSQNIFLSGGSENGVLVALDHVSGNIRWIGANSRSVFNLSAEISSDNIWLGEIEGFEIYSNPGFLLTQAYDAETHELLWQNSHIVLRKILGIFDNTIVGLAWEPSQSLSVQSAPLIVGIDSVTGEEKWVYRYEQTQEEIMIHGKRIIQNAWLIGNDLLYVLDKGSTLWFINPATGELSHDLEVGFDEGIYTLLEWTDRIIVISSTEIGMIKP